MLHPLLGRPLCAYPVARALEVGAGPVVAVVGHHAEAVSASLRKLFPDRPLSFAVQTEQRGPRTPVRSAREALKDWNGPV